MVSSESGSATPPREKKGSPSPARRRGGSRSSSSPRRRERSPPRGPKPSFNGDIQPNPKLFVTNIDSKFSREETEKDLRELFESYGEIRDITVKTKPGSANTYVFVEFISVDSAKQAQQALQGKEFKGKELKVEFGRGERRNQDRRAGVCYVCRREGHFAKDCRYNTRDRRSPDRRREYDRDYRRDDRERSRRRRRSYSYSPSSSDSRDYRHRRDRDRDSYRSRHRHSPGRKDDYYSRRH